jgi:hypothetical protein
MAHKPKHDYSVARYRRSQPLTEAKMKHVKGWGMSVAHRLAKEGAFSLQTGWNTTLAPCLCPLP